MPHYPNTSGYENLILLYLIYLHWFHHLSYSLHPSNLSEASCRVPSKWVSLSHLHMHHAQGVHTLSLSHSSDVHSSSMYHNKVATPFSTVICLLAANSLTDVVIKVLEQTTGMVSSLSSAVCLQGEPYYSSKVSATISLS